MCHYCEMSEGIIGTVKGPFKKLDMNSCVENTYPEDTSKASC